MNDIDENITPVKGDVDPKSLDIDPSPEEFFVLSRVDGSMTIDQICKTSGLGPDKTMECIRNLRDYGLIRIPGAESADDGEKNGGEATPQHVRNQRADTDRSSSSSEASVEENDSGDTPPPQDDSRDDGSDELADAIRSRFPVSFDQFDFDRQLLEQSVEIDDDFKREVIYVYQQLEDVNHYELLGVDQNAQRRQLRKAYFRMSKRYHPDRFYQKILGDYEKMIEAVFQRVTRAYQTLTNSRKRDEYDAALKQNDTGHQPDQRASTPASRRSEPREVMKGDQKKDMAYKVLVQRSDKALEEGEYTTALDGYRKALSLKRDPELALRVARELVESAHRLDDAASFARAAQKIADSPAPALQLLGRIYEKKDSPEDALYHYEQAQQAGADNPDLQQRIDRLKQ